MVERMRVEFGVELRLEPLPFELARRADAELAGDVRAAQGADALFRSDGEMLAVFRSGFDLRRFVRGAPGVSLVGDPADERLVADA